MTYDGLEHKKTLNEIGTANPTESEDSIGQTANAAEDTVQTADE